MLALSKWGLGRDVVALLISAVVLAGLLAGGAGRVVEMYFSRAVTGLVGAPGEYDAIVHLKQEAGEAALRALEERLAEMYPGYSSKEAPPVAGHFNVVIGLPNERRNQSGLESLTESLSGVPGFDGLTYIIEPAVVIKDVRPELVSEFVARARAMEGVSFAFASGSSVWAVLRSPGDAERVQRALETLTAEHVILEIQPPVALGERVRDALLWELVDKLETSDPSWQASPLAAGAGGDGAAGTLQRARQIIAELGAVDTGALRQELLALADAIEGALAEAQGAIGSTGDEGADLAYVVDAFRQAVDQVEILDARLAEVTGYLKDAAAQGEAADVIVALLLQKLLDRLGGGAAQPVAPGPSVDVQELRAGVEAIEATLQRLGELRLDEVAATLRRLATALPGIDPQAARDIVEAMDALSPAGQGGAQRLAVLVRGVQERERVLSVATQAAGTSARVYAGSAGVVQPDARTAVLQLLTGLRRVVTALVTLLVLALVHVFDVATLASLARRLAEVEGIRARRIAAALALWGALFGSAASISALWLASGGEMAGAPLLAAAGAAVGTLTALASERCAPVEPEVFCAAVSLGVPEANILREVVVPAGRPGLLYWLTRPGRALGGRHAWSAR